MIYYLYGEKTNKTEIRKCVGDISQIAGAVPLEYTSGKAKGTSAIEVRNGSGLRFVVLPDRGMDIGCAEFKGIPLVYISKTGIVSPNHYDKLDFLRSFSAGLLTTCGLTYMGASCVDEGVSLGAHGRISNTPASDVSVVQEWVDDETYAIEIRGKVTESTVFGEHMVLTRTIRTVMGDNQIEIKDIVENCGFEPTPLMLLYHINFGYPLVSKNTMLKTNCINLRPRDEIAIKGIADTEIFQKPTYNYQEQVFYRDSVPTSYATLSNPDLGISSTVEYESKNLPYLIEWKQMGEQEYVIGLEPATWYPEGRAQARKRGELMTLLPQKTVEFNVSIKLE